MIKNLFLLFFLLSSFNGSVHPQSQSPFDYADLNQKARRAYFRLLKAEEFSIGHTGYTGERSDDDLALRDLIKSKNSLRALISLVESASPEGKLYGLFGLRLKEKTAYEKALLNSNSGYEPPARSSFWGTRELETDNTGAIIVKGIDEGIIPKGAVVTGMKGVIQIKKWHEVISAIESGDYDNLFNRR